MSHALIESLTTIIVDLPTIRPHKLAMHTMQKQTLVILRLRCSDGVEASAKPPPLALWPTDTKARKASKPILMRTWRRC